MKRFSQTYNRWHYWSFGRKWALLIGNVPRSSSNVYSVCKMSKCFWLYIVRLRVWNRCLLTVLRKLKYLEGFPTTAKAFVSAPAGNHIYIWGPGGRVARTCRCRDVGLWFDSRPGWTHKFWGRRDLLTSWVSAWLSKERFCTLNTYNTNPRTTLTTFLTNSVHFGTGSWSTSQ